MTKFLTLTTYDKARIIYVNPARIAYLANDDLHQGTRTKIAFSEETRDYIYVQDKLDEIVIQLSTLTNGSV